MKKNKKSITHTREQLIKNIARKTNQSVETVRQIYNTLDTVVFDTLTSVTEDNDVKIKLFNGMTIEGTFVPSKNQMNNLIGQMVQTASKIKPKVTLSRNYKERLNQKNEKRYNRQ